MRKRTVIGLVLLVFCVVCRFSAPVAEVYSRYLYPVVSQGLSFLGSTVPFSLEEIVVLSFVAALLFILGKAVRKKEGFLRTLGKTAVVLLWLYVWFYMGWGNHYYRPGFYERNGIRRVSYEPEAFKRFLEEFSTELNRAAYASGTYDRDALETEIKAFYSGQVSSFGYAKLRRWQHVKKPLLNPLYSAVGVHGFMGPFFCEPQVNLSLLEHEYPYTLAHEMGHLSGVTSEAEASYWGFAFCRQSGNAAVRYSGYLAILPYVLSNAWHLLPEEEFTLWTETLCEKAREDYKRSRDYWEEKRVAWISDTQSWIFNLYLKSNGVSEGIKDYSGVVGMILTMDREGSMHQANARASRPALSVK